MVGFLPSVPTNASLHQTVWKTRQTDPGLVAEVCLVILDITCHRINLDVVIHQAFRFLEGRYPFEFFAITVPDDVLRPFQTMYFVQCFVHSRVMM